MDMFIVALLGLCFCSVIALTQWCERTTERKER